MAKKNRRNIPQTKPLIPFDNSKTEFVNRKKELIIKDYESLFTVYGRETSIVYNFRGWTIILLTVYFTYIFTVKVTNFGFLFLPGIFIILTFYFLEVSERSVMRYLLRELRDPEKMFMIENTQDFNTAVLNFEFRDLRDAKKPLSDKIGDFLKAMVSLKVISWNLFLLLIYFSLVYFYQKDIGAKQQPSQSSNLPTAKKDTITHRKDTVKLIDIKKK